MHMADGSTDIKSDTAGGIAASRRSTDVSAIRDNQVALMPPHRVPEIIPERTESRSERHCQRVSSSSESGFSYARTFSPDMEAKSALKLVQQLLDAARRRNSCQGLRRRYEGKTKGD
jgi:hypothetical protein